MSVKFVTPEAISSYVHVFKPAETPSGAIKYSIALLFPKETTDLALMKAAIKKAAVEKFGDKVKMETLRLPIRDGDTKDQAEYHGHWFINASSSEDYPPKIVLSVPGAPPILDPREFYSGCVCRASINFFGYSTAGNKGIGAGLNAIAKVRDGEPLGNTVDPEKEFAEFLTGTTDDNDLGF